MKHHHVNLISRARVMRATRDCYRPNSPAWHRHNETLQNLLEEAACVRMDAGAAA
jgi:hypothetical protein